MNKFIISGRLTKTPELAEFNGNKSCLITVASDTFVKRGDKFEKEAAFNSVKVFGKQAENCARYLEKGQSVLVEGSLKTIKSEKTGNYQTYLTASEVEFGSKAGGSSNQETKIKPVQDTDFDNFEPPF